jgi:hypothetical protein
VKALLTLIVVVLLLLVAADRVAWYVAERGVAQAIQDSENLEKQPDVSIGGIPFLTQAWSGVYEDVDVTFEDFPAAEGVTVDKLDANLEGVRIPRQDIVDRSVKEAPVDRAVATAWVGFDALNIATSREVGTDELKVTYGAGSAPDRLSVTGTYAGPAGNLELKGEARLEVQGGSLVVTLVPESLNVPPIVRDTIARLIGLTYRLPELPFGFEARSVTVGTEGVRVTAEAQDVVLGSPERAA